MTLRMEKLNRYLDLARAAYYIEDGIGFESDPAGDKEALTQGILEKKDYENRWVDLLNELRQDKTFRARDMSGAGVRQSFTGMASYNLSSFGLVFGISFPFRLYGFYYCRFDEIGDTNKYKREFSYKAFDLEMEFNRKKIEGLISKYFQGFEPFDNSYADFKIDRIYMGRSLHLNIDLWRVLVTLYDQGLI